MNRHMMLAAPHASHFRLPPNSVYRSPEGREVYLDFYDKVLARQPGAVRTRDVATRYGRTRITTGGNARGRPLVVLPGMSIAGPAMLEFFARLGRERCLVAPDLIGQPGMSEDRFLKPGDHAYARWLSDVLDALGLEQADIASASFGASIALDLAAIAPRRIGRLALMMPAGLTPRLPLATIYARLAANWFFYRHVPVRSLLPGFARPLSASLTADNLDYLDIVIRHTAFWRHKPAGPFGPNDLGGYRTPVFLVMADGDILFPFAPTRENARNSLVIAHEVVLENCPHMPSDAQIAPVLDQIAAFLG